MRFSCRSSTRCAVINSIALNYCRRFLTVGTIWGMLIGLHDRDRQSCVSKRCTDRRYLLSLSIDAFMLPTAQGVATRDDIDKTLKLGMAHPMGPLQLGPFHLLQSPPKTC